MPRNHLLKTNYVFPHEWLILDANKAFDLGLNFDAYLYEKVQYLIVVASIATLYYAIAVNVKVNIKQSI